MRLARIVFVVTWLTVTVHGGTFPNVVLITLDTMRADRMGFLGSKRGLTPTLDALARQSITFTRAFAQAPLTTPSHATILTGTYPQFHKVNDFEVPLAKDIPYAPEIFRKHGFSTAAFVSSIILDPNARFAPGFDRGFDTYDAGFHRRRPGEDRYSAIERRADEVVNRASRWISRHPERPFFIWVHLYDAHDPYDPPEPYKSRYATVPYDGEIAFVDSALNQLLAQLKQLRLFDNALIAVMADHGEGLGDHGELSHGSFLYDETVHVPLLLKLPKERYSGKSIDTCVELVDVLPTMLQSSGIAIPSDVQGRSLLSDIAEGGTLRTATASAMGQHRCIAYSESDYPKRAFGWSALRALRKDKYLAIEAPKRELYDQSIDQKAQHNVYASGNAVSQAMFSEIDSFRAKTASSREIASTSMDPERAQKLAALGYLPTDIASTTLPGVKDTGADPKDKIEIVNLLHQAELLNEDMDYQQAAALLEQVISKDPNLPIAYLQLGTAYSILKNYQRALPVLRRAAQLRPDLGTPQFQLGSALLETGDFAGAAEQFETVTSLFPDWADAHFYLGTSYARTNRMQKAVEEYRRVIQLRPNHYAAHLLLGRALELTEQFESAIAPLRRAAELAPRSGEPHLFLSDVYMKLNRNNDAEREKREAQRLGSR